MRMQVLVPNEWATAATRITGSSRDFPRSFQSDDPAVELFVFPAAAEWPAAAVQEALCLALGYATLDDPELVRLDSRVINWRGSEGKVSEVVSSRNGKRHGFSWAGRDASIVAVGDSAVFHLEWVIADLLQLEREGE